MRGLVTAGRAVRQERFCWSRNLERSFGGVNPVAAHSGNAGRLLAQPPPRLLGPAAWGPGLVVHDGQGPAPAGELAGDRDVGHDRFLLAVGEVQPPLVQALVAG